MKEKKNKKKLNVKKIILIIGGICIIVVGTIVLRLLFNKKFKKDYNPEDYSFSVALEKAVKEINEINKVFTSDKIDLSSAENLYPEENTTCYRYIGEDIKEFYDKLSSIYQDPGRNHYFNTSVDDKGEIINIYVCRHNACEPTEIDSNDAIIKEDDGNTVKGTLKGHEFQMDHLTTGEWMLLEPIVTC